MKNNENSQRQKRTRIVYGVSVAVLIALSIVIAVTSAANRREEAHHGDGSENSVGELTSDIAKESGSESEKLPSASEYEPPLPPDTSSDDVDQKVEDKLPTFSSPVDGTLAKAYSTELPVYSLTLNEYRTHSGIDISASVGSAVKAVADGVIGEVWQDPMMGWCVSVIHSGGAVSCYRNLSNELPEGIAKDKTVSQGDVIGAVGDSSLLEVADDAHLHFELAINGKTVDPLKYFSLPSSGGYEDK